MASYALTATWIVAKVKNPKCIVLPLLKHESLVLIYSIGVQMNEELPFFPIFLSNCLFGCGLVETLSPIHQIQSTFFGVAKISGESIIRENSDKFVCTRRTIFPQGCIEFDPFSNASLLLVSAIVAIIASSYNNATHSFFSSSCSGRSLTLSFFFEFSLFFQKAL